MFSTVCIVSLTILLFSILLIFFIWIIFFHKSIANNPLIDNYAHPDELKNNKKKIAIVTMVPWHFECLGFLLDMLSDKYEITFFSVPDKEGYVDYFNKVYDFKKLNVRDGALDQNYYDRIIKLTSTDPFIFNDLSKGISIHHYNTIHHLPQYPTVYPTAKQLSFISLSKLVRIEELINKKAINITPIFKTLKIYPPQERLNQIILVGEWEDGPLNSLVKNFTYKIVNIRRNPRPIDAVNCLYDNISCIYKPDTMTLIELVSKSKFLFIQPKSDRFSGAIALGLSCHIPMIIDKEQSTYYDFPCFTYKNYVTELKEELNTMSEKEYEQFMEKYTKYIKDTQEENYENSNNFLKF